MTRHHHTTRTWRCNFILRGHLGASVSPGDSYLPAGWFWRSSVHSGVGLIPLVSPSPGHHRLNVMLAFEYPARFNPLESADQLFVTRREQMNKRLSLLSSSEKPHGIAALPSLRRHEIICGGDPCRAIAPANEPR